MNNKSIGIFDSGLGGLTILRELRKIMPGEDIIYFGDLAHLPYGSKSPEAIKEFSVEIAQFLQDQGVKILLIACNTASALALKTVEKNLKIPVLGVIEAGAIHAAQKTKNQRVAVIGTSATVKSGAYEKELKKINKNLRIGQFSCPLFVPLIEENWNKTKVAQIVAEQYMKPVQKSKADALILGCTHYPIIKNLIKKILGPGVAVVDSSVVVAARAKEMLVEGDMTSGKKSKGNLTLYVSDSPKHFAANASKILGVKIKKVHLKKFN